MHTIHDAHQPQTCRVLTPKQRPHAVLSPLVIVGELPRLPIRQVLVLEPMWILRVRPINLHPIRLLLLLYPLRQPGHMLGILPGELLMPMRQVPRVLFRRQTRPHLGQLAVLLQRHRRIDHLPTLRQLLRHPPILLRKLPVVQQPVPVNHVLQHDTPAPNLPRRLPIPVRMLLRQHHRPTRPTHRLDHQIPPRLVVELRQRQGECLVGLHLVRHLGRERGRR